MISIGLIITKNSGNDKLKKIADPNPSRAYFSLIIYNNTILKAIKFLNKIKTPLLTGLGQFFFGNGHAFDLALGDGYLSKLTTLP